MSKSTVTFVLSLLFCLSGISQNTIKGIVLNEQDQPLEYATVALLNPADSILQYFGVTNTKGEYQIKGIKKGQYLIQFSFVGMQTTYDQINIPLSSGEAVKDKILQTASLEEVVVEAELIPIRFKSDTLEFDAKAFKTRPGAAVEELLRQLPGVEVDNTGNIRAEGEEVTKILVDGKEFFDDDPKVATKNLPAKALNKVQVIDRKTEEAIFSGIDDGQREKTINLKLKEDYKKGYFGEISTGFGSKETYKIEGKIYHFTKKTQNALLGMSNNINEFGFTNKDNLQFGSNNKGLNEALAGGLNLSYNPSSQNRYFLNYLGNRRVKNLMEDVYTENFLSNTTYNQNQDIEAVDTDQLQRFKFGIRQNFNTNQRLLLDGRININASDILTKAFTSSQLEEQLFNTLDNETNNNSNGLFLWTKASYIVKFNNDNTQLKTIIGGIHDGVSNRLDWVNLVNFFEPISEIMLQQFQTNDKERLFLFAEPSILQKLNQNWSLSLGARVALDDNKLIRKEAKMNDLSEFEEIDIPEFTTQQRLIWPNLIINRSKKNVQLNIQFKATINQFTKLQNTVRIQKKKYFFLTPQLNYQNEYRSGRRINLRYTSNIVMPTPEQLIPVRNAINQLNIVQGNPELEPEQRHLVFSNWTIFDQFSFTSFSLRLSGEYTKHKIRWAQSISDDFVKVMQPINVNNDINLSASADFSTPLRSLGLNLNIKAIESWNSSIVFINEQENINKNINHSLNLALENRKNEIFSIRLSTAVSYTDSRFSIAQDQNNTYFNTSYTGDFRFTPNNKWNFEARANIVNYNAQSFDEAVSIPLISANVSYFFLQAEKGSLTLSAFDILNQNTGFQRVSNTNLLMQQQWNTLTQYFMLTFNMRFR